jgi:hypothetical protein
MLTSTILTILNLSLPYFIENIISIYERNEDHQLLNYFFFTFLIITSKILYGMFDIIYDNIAYGLIQTRVF